MKGRLFSMQIRSKLTEAREVISAQGSGSLPGDDLVGADYRGANLAGLRMACGSLRGVDLRDANLSGAWFWFVDFTGALLDGAAMAETRFHFADLSGASMRAASAPRSHWQSSELSGSDLSSADLTDASFRVCTLQRARFDKASLRAARLASCLCEDASFRAVDFAGVCSVDSSYRRAEFVGAKAFFTCREILGELLAREAGDDFEAIRSVGAVLMGPKWCWPEWAAFLNLNPTQRDMALAAFSRYPESGAAEALRLAIRQTTLPR